ncbi:hypothetical protein DFP73DRAFT_583223 [Morchella snyderi]|nr:hypothetical protein DFP73DRAFT_583223 [Morchella snyderi]
MKYRWGWAWLAKSKTGIEDEQNYLQATTQQHTNQTAMAFSNSTKPISISRAGTSNTLKRRPARRDMSNPDPTARRIPIPSMLRSATLQPRPRPTPPPPNPEPRSLSGPYTPFANRGPYVFGDPGPYWLRLDDSEPELGCSPTKIERRKTFADRGPYVAMATVKRDMVPDRSPTVSPVSMLSLPRFDMGSQVSLAEASEVGVRGVKRSIHKADNQGHSSPRPSTVRIRSAPLQNLNPDEQHDRLQDPVEDDGCFDDPIIAMRHFLMRSGSIRQEPIPDPIRTIPRMPRSQSLYMVPTLSTLPASYSLTYEERFDIFAGFDGVGKQRVSPEGGSDGDQSSVVAEASLTRESTPVYLPADEESGQRLERVPSNPEFGPIRFERSRAGLSFLDFDEFEGCVAPGRGVPAAPMEVLGVVAVVEERLRKPKLKHRIKHLSEKITMVVERMRRSE